VLSYSDSMRENAFVLCPGGEGWGSTLRSYEACFFGRVPVVISDSLMVWEDILDTTFFIKLSPSLTDEEMASALAKLFEMSDLEIADRCRSAVLYFEHVIRRHFRNPTEFFLAWMGKTGGKNG